MSTTAPVLLPFILELDNGDGRLLVVARTPKEARALAEDERFSVTDVSAVSPDEVLSVELFQPDEYEEADEYPRTASVRKHMEAHAPSDGEPAVIAYIEED